MPGPYCKSLASAARSAARWPAKFKVEGSVPGRGCQQCRAGKHCSHAHPPRFQVASKNPRVGEIIHSANLQGHSCPCLLCNIKPKSTYLTKIALYRMFLYPFLAIRSANTAPELRHATTLFGVNEQCRIQI